MLAMNCAYALAFVCVRLFVYVFHCTMPGLHFGCVYDGVSSGGAINAHAAQCFTRTTLSLLQTHMAGEDIVLADSSSNSSGSDNNGRANDTKKKGSGYLWGGFMDTVAATITSMGKDMLGSIASGGSSKKQPCQSPGGAAASQRVSQSEMNQRLKALGATIFEQAVSLPVMTD